MMEDVVNQQWKHNLGDEKMEYLPCKSDNLKSITRKQIKNKTKKAGHDANKKKKAFVILALDKWRQVDSWGSRLVRDLSVSLSFSLLPQHT